MNSPNHLGGTEFVLMAAKDPSKGTAALWDRGGGWLIQEECVGVTCCGKALQGLFPFCFAYLDRILAWCWFQTPKISRIFLTSFINRSYLKFHNTVLRYTPNKQKQIRVDSLNLCETQNSLIMMDRDHISERSPFEQVHSLCDGSVCTIILKVRSWFGSIPHGEQK